MFCVKILICNICQCKRQETNSKCYNEDWTAWQYVLPWVFAACVHNIHVQILLVGQDLCCLHIRHTILDVAKFFHPETRLQKHFCLRKKTFHHAALLIHLGLKRLPHTIYCRSWISVLCCQATWFRYSKSKMAKLFANSGDSDQLPHSTASDLGLYCLPITLLRGLQTKMGSTKIVIPRTEHNHRTQHFKGIKRYKVEKG